MPRDSSLRGLPSVDRVLRELPTTDLPRPNVLSIVREELDAARQELMSGGGDAIDIVGRVNGRVAALRLERLQPLINATGVIIHTNFGRAPMGRRVADAVARAALDYGNLEYDLERGERGNRGAYVEQSLALLCGAEAATVVNNCAAALVLALRHFTAHPERREVVVCRGELVQIGGGFRIPEILEASGAILREVGTTNRTTVEDYQRVMGPQTAMLLKVHQSNFYMGGFIESPEIASLSALARDHATPLVVDIGSGALFDTSELGGGEHEPLPARTLERGANLVTFSGDKLFGGPQCGIIAGAAGHISALKREPFFRALRCDKLILAALQATIDLHLSAGSDRGSTEIPIFEMMKVTVDQLRERAARLVHELEAIPLRVEIGAGEARVGGGTLPRTTMPSVTLDVTPKDGLSVDAMATRLRLGSPPVVGYVSGGLLRLDLRTIFPRQDEQLVHALQAAASARVRGSGA